MLVQNKVLRVILLNLFSLAHAFEKTFVVWSISRGTFSCVFIRFTLLEVHHACVRVLRVTYS